LGCPELFAVDLTPSDCKLKPGEDARRSALPLVFQAGWRAKPRARSRVPRLRLQCFPNPVLLSGISEAVACIEVAAQSGTWGGPCPLFRLLHFRPKETHRLYLSSPQPVLPFRQSNLRRWQSLPRIFSRRIRTLP